jgi:hypothetical protein
MKPVLSTKFLFDDNADYPESMFEHFSPIMEMYNLIVVMTDGLLASGPVSALEIEAILDANATVSRFIDILSKKGIIIPSKKNIDVTLNSCLSAILAMKIRDRHIYEATKEECINRCRQLLDYIVNDERVSKKETIETLTELKMEITRRIKHVRTRHAKPFKFLPPPEKYSERTDKKENPEQFFDRVYKKFLVRGIKPVHLKYEDEGYYNVLHVWCSRRGKDINRLFDREEPDRDTTKQKLNKKMRKMKELSPGVFE